MTNSKQLRKLITLDIKEFSSMIPISGSILGLDLGEKRIGLAICNNTRSIATSLKTINRGKLLDDINIIKNIIVSMYPEMEDCGKNMEYIIDGCIEFITTDIDSLKRVN